MSAKTPMVHKTTFVIVQIVAHEIGHNFGMKHDFDVDANDDVIDRYDSKGDICTGIGGIMDYYGAANMWSTCSVEDMTTRYDDWMSDYPQLGWCLTECKSVFSQINFTLMQ